MCITLVDLHNVHVPLAGLMMCILQHSDSWAVFSDLGPYGPGEFLSALVNPLRSTYLNPVVLPGMGLVGPGPNTQKSSLRYNSSLFQVAI